MKFTGKEKQGPKLILNILVLGVALFVASKQEITLKKSSVFEDLMVDFIAPMQRSVTFLHGKMLSIFEHYFNNVNASKQNQTLVKKVSQLERKIFEYEELDRENRRLKELLRFGEDISWKKVLAQIVAWDASSDFRVLRINKGLLDGIKLQSTVVTDEGLVGYIYRLTNHFADILTILDPNNRIDGIVQRIRSHGVVEGFTNGKCLMKYVARARPVILNDLVLTSGLGNVYPKGLEIGQVSRIERESYGAMHYIEILPSVNFGRLEEVMVLVSQEDRIKKREWEILDQGPGK